MLSRLSTLSMGSRVRGNDELASAADQVLPVRWQQ